MHIHQYVIGDGFLNIIATAYAWKAVWLGGLASRRSEVGSLARITGAGDLVGGAEGASG